MMWLGKNCRSELGEIWKFEFGLLRRTFFVGLFTGHFAGFSPASFSPARSSAKGAKRNKISTYVLVSTCVCVYSCIFLCVCARVFILNYVLW